MSGNVDRVFAVDVDRPHFAPVRWMKGMADKLDVLWSAFDRNRTMSVASEGDGEYSDSCRSGMISHQFLSAVNNANNVPSVRISEDIDTVEPRRIEIGV